MLRIWPLLLGLSEGQYTACVPGRYGRECEHLCACKEFEECDDGPSGSGECSCMAGEEVRCGPPPPPSGPDSASGLGSAASLVFQNLTLSSLALDPETSRRSRQVFNASISLTRPQPFRGEPRLVLLNHQVARRLGLVSELVDEDLLQLLSGRRLPSTAQPFAHAYGGHQFGSWSGQLGDGRAMSLGNVLGFAPDVKDQDTLRSWPWELSLKGAGKTPYSRGGDGRAALANAAREFFAPIFLESMGVPVCGTLAVLGSDAEEDRLMRDEWYSGQMSMKKPAITVRVMPSFLRFGSAQLAAKRQGAEGLARLARYALEVLAQLERHDDASASYLMRLRQPVPKDLRRECFFVRMDPPSCAESFETKGVLRCLLERLVQRTAALVAAWMAVGFAHGVMNTDNLSLLGVTVDLNVFGFVSKYDPSWAPNHIDETARYAFGAQSEIAKWNLQRLSDAFTGTPFVADREPDAEIWPKVSSRGKWLDPSTAADEVKRFDAQFERCFVARMEVRLGLPATGLPCAAGVSGVSSGCVVKQWVQWLERTGADYPRASKGLSDILEDERLDGAERLAEHAGANSSSGLQEILQQLRQLGDSKQMAAAIRAAVPKLTLRSHVLAEASKLVEIQRPGSKPRQFLKVLQQLMEEPFDEREAMMTVDDPRAFWQKTDLSTENPEDEDLPRKLQERLYAVPPDSLKQLRTSCGAQ